MERLKLTAKLREEVGKEAVKGLRRQGLVPAVVYGSKHPFNISVENRDFAKIIHTKAGENVIVDLQVTAQAKHKGRAAAKSKPSVRTVIIKEIQYHPVRADILHIDFNEISLTEALTVKVPIAAKGEAQGIKEGGVLEHILWEVEVECLPTQIPENISADVTPLNIGDAILVKDLQIPPGVKILADPEATVITLSAPRAEEEVKPEEEQVEPEVIMEKKPEEEEVPAEEAAEKKPEPEKEKK